MLRPIESAPEIQLGEDLGFEPLQNCPDCCGRGWFCENQMAEYKKYRACPTCWAAKIHSDEHGKGTLPADIEMVMANRQLLADLMGVELEDHADQIDEMFAVVALYLANKEAAAQLPKRKARKDELAALAKALDVVLHPGETTEHVFSGTAEYAELLRSASTVNSILQTMLAEKSAHGPEPDDRKWMLNRLACVYSEITGLPPKISWSERAEMYCGRFYEVCRVLLPQFTWDSLGNSIREVLATSGKEQ